MTTLRRTEQQYGAGSDQASRTLSRAAEIALGVLRLFIGWTFLWAFFDRLLALGFATGVTPRQGVVDRFGDAAWMPGHRWRRLGGLVVHGWSARDQSVSLVATDPEGPRPLSARTNQALRSQAW